MSAKESPAPPSSKSIAQYVAKNAAKVKAANTPAGHGHGGDQSVREADYKGHHIVVRTTYRVEIDGVPITGHMGVTNDGQVHYHSVPNIAYASAVDLLKALIDIFPDDFGSGGSGAHGNGHGGGTHQGHAHPGKSQRGRASKGPAANKRKNG